ncbi:MAG: ABC-F family ATP-binding cassette domain-containing protein [Bacteroidetes bacterium]|uniref:ABC-F family ATP-binding cassette domain-containing protein n=1 Tax=Candidatus Limisoma faecipullorum TaxID=2840854 RepID=A0A9D9ISC1_9BACT|nr:ABC-F family ATP-binding cassette domain-containing protein [Candidatus Limisoma faecipullorum]
MKSYLQIENLTKSFGDRLLFGDVTFGVFEGDKIGLIAKNGSGKTTLLRIIAGEEDYDSGAVVFRNDLKVAFLHQMPEFDLNLMVIDVCLSGNDAITETIKEYEDSLATGDAVLMANAISRMDAVGGWDYEDRMKQVLTQLNITDFNQPVRELSGGQRKRLALAKAIISNPDFLILDEPTNHLDVEMIEWLEDYLKRSRMTLLMVTHDRYFLDRVCTKIIELDDKQIYSYDGNYDYYLSKREERINAQNAELAKVKNLLRTELEWMRCQPQARGTKAKYRIDAFYDLSERAKFKRDDSSVSLTVNSSYIGNKIFEARNVSKKFGDRVILDNFSYVFARYEKLGIIGDNGVGKSTFIKLLQGIEQVDSGSFDIGETVKFGYYSQEGIQFDENEKVIDAVRKIAEVVCFDERTRYTASQFLQLFLFSPSAQQDYIGKLSGGEKRRLYLATVLMHKPNFLILDEPTNDLDIVTLEILEDYLQKFKGCVIIVSHDRFFMDRTVDHLFVFEGNGRIKDFPGNYSEYREWKSLQKEEDVAVKEKKSIQRKSQDDNRQKSKRLTFNERKEFESLSVEIESLESEKKTLEAELSSGQISDYEQVTEKSKRISEIIGLLDEKEMRWLELSEKE